ncbi:MAG: hypothetical protein RQ745_04340 [Longimicrobiales bacterium]|nr:hypothetical protein [Longimicrobiales bacterium]
MGLVRALQRSLFLAAAVLAACEPPAPGAPFTVTDSAGIRIVTVSTGAIPDTLQASGVPTWSAESITVDELHYLSGVQVQPVTDGRVVVGESEGYIWLGDPVAGAWTAIARPGDGPREIGRLAAIRFHHGAIWAADAGRDRLLEFGLDGDLLSERRVSPTDVVTSNWAPGRDAHLFLGSGPGWGASEELIQRTHAPVVRVSAERIDTLLEVPNVEWFATDGGMGVPYLNPWGHLTGRDEILWIGDSAEAEVVRWSDSITTIVRWTYPSWDARAVADSLIDAVLAGIPAAQLPPAIEAYIRNIPLSPEPLKFDGLVLRDDGGVVIGPRWATAGDQVTRPAGAWLAIASDGVPDYVVILPAGFEPSYFGDDHVLGIFRDEVGREAVQRRELVAR